MLLINLNHHFLYNRLMWKTTQNIFIKFYQLISQFVLKIDFFVFGQAPSCGVFCISHIVIAAPYGRRTVLVSREHSDNAGAHDTGKKDNTEENTDRNKILPEVFWFLLLFVCVVVFSPKIHRTPNRHLSTAGKQG